jgi:MFS family permease
MTQRHRLGRAFSLLWFSSASSAVGTGMTVTALPLLAAVNGESELVLGVIAAAGLVPALLLAVPTGMLADHYDRKKLLIWSHLARFVVLLVATALVLTDTIGPIALVLVAFFIGVGETVYVGCAQALVPLVVVSDDLDEANGRLQAAEDTAREFVGPPLGSALFSVASWIPFGADAVTYLASAGLLARMPSPPHERATERPSMRPAWDVFRRSRPLQVIGAALLVLAFAGEAVGAMLVLVVRDELGVSEFWFGPFIAVLALGSTAAGVVAGRLRTILSARASMVIAVALNAWAYLVIGLADQWPLVLGALFIWGLSVTYGLITSLGVRQRLIPLDLLGRTMGLFRTVVGAGAVLGALSGGVLATATSATTVATVAGLVQLPVILLVLFGIPSDASLEARSGE